MMAKVRDPAILPLLAAGIGLALFGRIIGLYLGDLADALAARLAESGITLIAGFMRFLHLALPLLLVLVGICMIVAAAYRAVRPRKAEGPTSLWDGAPGFPDRAEGFSTLDGGLTISTRDRDRLVAHHVYLLGGFALALPFGLLGQWAAGKPWHEIAEQIMEFRDHGIQSELFAGYIASMVGVGVFVLVMFLYKKYRQRNDLRCVLELSDEPVLPGKELGIQLSQESGNPISEAVVRLVCLESRDGATDESDRDRTDVVYTHEQKLLLPSRESAEGFLFRTEMHIPPDGLHSFWSKSHAISWYLAIGLVDNGGKTHDLRFDFRVAPEFVLSAEPQPGRVMMEEDSPILEEA